MNGLFNAAALYGRYIAVSMRGQMQYRLSFLILLFGQTLLTVAEFIGIVILFQRFGRLADWSLPEVALYYGLVSCSFAISGAISTGFDRFPRMVRTGDFDRLLLRPRATALQLAGTELTLRHFGRLFQGAAVLTWALLTLQTPLGFADLALLLFAVVGGVCLFFGLLVLQATIAFWTIESLELMNALTYGGVETASYPMSIYRRWFQRFFTFVVPLACVTHFPLQVVLDRAEPNHILLFSLAPAVGMLFCGLCLYAWRFGVRHYASTGS